ncbi:MAG: hypothetical protein ACYTFG_08920 [Planctomycetota bacterium]|jgi:hypothetical protein
MAKDKSMFTVCSLVVAAVMLLAGADTAFAQAPPPPASITVPATSATGSYSVSWNSSAGATGYELQEDTNSSFTTAVTVYSGASTSYFVSGKTSGTFFYRVRASNGSGNSGWTVGGNSCTIVAPNSPATVTVPATSTSSFSVSWSSSSGATSYELQEDTNSSFTTATTIYTGASTSRFISGKTSGTFYYRVRAVNGAGQSGWTAGGNGCTIVPPAAPASINVPATSPGTFTISWSGSSGATSYTLEEDTNSSFTSPTVVYTGTS